MCEAEGGSHEPLQFERCCGWSPTQPRSVEEQVQGHNACAKETNLSMNSTNTVQDARRETYPARQRLNNYNRKDTMKTGSIHFARSAMLTEYLRYIWSRPAPTRITVESNFLACLPAPVPIKRLGIRQSVLAEERTRRFGFGGDFQAEPGIERR